MPLVIWNSAARVMASRSDSKAQDRVELALPVEGIDVVEATVGSAFDQDLRHRSRAGHPLQHLRTLGTTHGHVVLLVGNALAVERRLGRDPIGTAPFGSSEERRVGKEWVR